MHEIPTAMAASGIGAVVGVHAAPALFRLARRGSDAIAARRRAGAR